MNKQTIFANWHTMRWIALSIGVFFGTIAILHGDLLTGFFSAFFLFQAATNTGCMVSRTCGMPENTSSSQTADKTEIEFTEVKNN